MTKTIMLLSMQNHVKCWINKTKTTWKKCLKDMVRNRQKKLEKVEPTYLIYYEHYMHLPFCSSKINTWLKMNKFIWMKVIQESYLSFLYAINKTEKKLQAKAKVSYLSYNIMITWQLALKQIGIYELETTLIKKITHMWRRWGTPLNFFLAFIE